MKKRYFVFCFLGAIGFCTVLYTQILMFKKVFTRLDELQSEIEVLKQTNLEQFDETLEMKQVYDDILKEQKKKTVETVMQSEASVRLEQEGDKFYAEKNYGSAFRTYKKLLEFQKDDVKIRAKKMKSLYYMNPYDSENYPEILSDIKALKAAGNSDSEVLKIERNIKSENGEINE